MRFVLASAIGIVLAVSAAAASPLSTTVQLRKLIAEANASDGQGDYGHPSETILAPDFGPFDETASASVTVSNGWASATSEQQSTISDWSYFATGGFSATAVGTYGDPGYWNASGDSHFRVYFTLSESVDYSLFGVARKEDRADVLIQLKEGGVDGTVFHQFWLSDFDTQTELPYSVQGTLLPGSYILFAWTNGGCAYLDDIGTCSGSYELSFVLDGATDAPALEAPVRVTAAPNPFRESTRFRLPGGAGPAVVFDTSGRRVLELSDDLVWDGRDSAGRAVPSGVYFVRAEGVRQITKVVRLR